MVVTRLRPLSVGRSAAIVAAVITFGLTALFELLILAAAVPAVLSGQGVPRVTGGLGLSEALILLVSPIRNGVAAFLGAALFAVLYNLFVGRFPIIEIEVE